MFGALWNRDRIRAILKVSEGRKTVTETESRQRTVFYRGTVQGVGFRYTVRHIAAQFRVTGYVRNLPDGRVVLVAEGTPEELGRFLGQIRTEMGHYIRHSQETDAPATGQFSHFDIRI
jgi:acylphosphatase